MRHVLVPILLSAFLTTGCASSLFTSSREEAIHQLRQEGFHPWHAEAGGFRLSGFMRPPREETNLLVIYIEGDGFAWVNRSTLSADPTPHEPVTLLMASKDPAPAVLYLARPCQYEGRQSPICHEKYWSSHRYAEEVVAAMNEAVNQAATDTMVRKIGLVGYSGGGVIAGLLAARRSDVAWWMTVAANLDLKAWIQHHDVSPMPDSLNPADFVVPLSHTRQLHLSGQEDTDVPPKVLLAYRQRFPNPTAIPARLVPEFDHHCCWGEEWTSLLNETAQWRNSP